MPLRKYANTSRGHSLPHRALMGGGCTGYWVHFESSYWQCHAYLEIGKRIVLYIDLAIVLALLFVLHCRYHFTPSMAILSGSPAPWPGCRAITPYSICTVVATLTQRTQHPPLPECVDRVWKLATHAPARYESSQYASDEAGE